MPRLDLLAEDDGDLGPVLGGYGFEHGVVDRVEYLGGELWSCHVGGMDEGAIGGSMRRTYWADIIEVWRNIVVSGQDASIRR